MTESRLQRWIQVQDPLARDLFRVIIRRLDALDVNQDTGAVIESPAVDLTNLETSVAGLQTAVADLDENVDGRLDDVEDDVDALDTRVTALESGSGSGALNLFRTQTVLSGGTNSSGKAEWLVAGTGLAIDVDTSGGASPVRIAFADGFDANGQKSYVYTIPADVPSAWAGLTANASNYLYIDYDPATGTAITGSCAEPPIYTKVFPLAHYNQRATGGAVVSGGTASGNCFDINHTVNTGWVSTQTGVGISGVAYIGYNFGVPRQITRVVYTNSSTATGNPTSVVAEWSNDGATWTPISTHTLGADSGATNVLTISAYNAANYFRLLANANLAVGQPWRVEQLVFQSLETGNHWFDPASMKMSVYNGAAWTEQCRVFVGECVTDATTVTAVYSYAYNGDFDSGWLGFAMSTPNNNLVLEHALGVSISQGVAIDAYYSAFGDDFDAVPITGMSHSSTFGILFWDGANALTQYNETRMYIHAYFIGSLNYYGELKARGYARIRLRRTW